MARVQPLIHRIEQCLIIISTDLYHKSTIKNYFLQKLKTQAAEHEVTAKNSLIAEALEKGSLNYTIRYFIECLYDHA